MAKSDRASKHLNRSANRASARAAKFMKDARGGSYDAARFTKDVTTAFLDMMDTWGVFLGYGASPNVGVAEDEKPSADWVNGVDITVRVLDEVPETGINWPTPKLRKIDGGASDIKVTQVDR